MKKFFIIPVAVFLGALSFTSCSDDDDDNNNGGGGDGTEYSDKTYGEEAINACADLCNQLVNANSKIGSSALSSDQETYLRDVIDNLVDNVIVPTYTDLADDVEDLEATLNGLTTSTITQEAINNACNDFKAARENWERSEAFLMGAASDFDIDPTIDSWPLNRTMLLSYFNNPTSSIDDQSILGFHALEFILFRDGQPRKVAEFQGNDTYKNFTSITGAQELAYAQTVCTLLKERTFQLQVAWEGETTDNADRVAVVRAAGLSYTTQNGLSYGENLKKAGISGSRSTFPNLTDAIAQIVSDDEGSCFGIANEVGTAKIANPFSYGDISYVESPYSYNSITDFQDNMRSIRNVWYGSTTGTAAEKSFHGFFASITDGAATNTAVEDAFNNAITKIGAMPAPFVKYVSTIWNIAFEDDEDWTTDEE